MRFLTIAAFVFLLSIPLIPLVGIADDPDPATMCLVSDLNCTIVDDGAPI